MTTPVFGLLGQKLGHSYSPTIHTELTGMEYRLFEREPEDVETFLANDEWQGLNVTIPYKRTVLPHLDELTERAKRMGNVNTIWRSSDGKLHGDNTDYAGFKMLVESIGIDVSGITALVLGATGGAGTTATKVLEDMGATVVSISRTGAVSYENVTDYADAELIVNATPVGMYPNCPEAPLSLDGFENLKAVLDIVYNPARTGLMLQAEDRGIATANGLLMLVGQAAEADRHFTGDDISLERIRQVTEKLAKQEMNIALIGMPGSGKTRVGQQLAKLTGREHVDVDHAFAEKLGISCSDYITTHGEEAFRREETAVLTDIAKRSRLIISTGGGIVTRPENYPLLHQNSTIVMLNRKLEELAHKNRPITARDGVQKLAKQRMPLYREWADIIVDSRDCAANTARAVYDELFEQL